MQIQYKSVRVSIYELPNSSSSCAPIIGDVQGNFTLFDIFICIYISHFHLCIHHLEKKIHFKFSAYAHSKYKSARIVYKFDCKVVVSFDIVGLCSNCGWLRASFLHYSYKLFHIHSFHTPVVIWHQTPFSTRLSYASFNNMSMHLVGISYSHGFIHIQAFIGY